MSHSVVIEPGDRRGTYHAHCNTCGYNGSSAPTKQRAREDAITHRYKTSPQQEAQWAGLHKRGYR